LETLTQGNLVISSEYHLEP